MAHFTSAILLLFSKGWYTFSTKIALKKYFEHFKKNNNLLLMNIILCIYFHDMFFSKKKTSLLKGKVTPTMLNQVILRGDRPFVNVKMWDCNKKR